MGVFHCPDLGNSITWMVIGCWPRSRHISVYIPACIVVSVNWMLVGTPGPVSVLLIFISHLKKSSQQEVISKK